VRIADIVNGSQLSTGKALSHAPVHHLKLELNGVSTTLPDEPSVIMVTICRDPSSDPAFCNTKFRRKELIAPFASEILVNHPPLKLYIEFPQETSKVASNSRGSVHSRGGSSSHRGYLHSTDTLTTDNEFVMKSFACRHLLTLMLTGLANLWPT
jgi:hypothetical protein